MANKRFGMTSWDDVEIKQPQKQGSYKDTFLALEDGDNIVRLLTKPFEFLVHKYKAHEKDPGFGSRVLSSAPLYGEDSDPLISKGLKPKRRWLVGVVDRKTQSYKILDLSVSVFKSIQELVRDEDWGDPKQYDINIKVDRNGGATGYYTVIPRSKKPLSAADLELSNQVDLDDLKRRTTPPSPEEMLKKIEAIHAKSDHSGPFGGEAKAAKPADDDDDDMDFPAVDA